MGKFPTLVKQHDFLKIGLPIRNATQPKTNGACGVHEGGNKDTVSINEGRPVIAGISYASWRFGRGPPTEKPNSHSHAVVIVRWMARVIPRNDVGIKIWEIIIDKLNRFFVPQQALLSSHSAVPS